MKVSFINGICLQNDAISNSIRDEIGFLQQSGDYDVHLFTYACDLLGVPHTIVGGIGDILTDSHFIDSDLVVLHFGVYYPLFNIIPLLPNRMKSVVVFHNITPKKFVRSIDHEVIDKSFSQLSNIEWADHVICDSQTNLNVLRSSGVSTQAVVLPLAVRIEREVPSVKPSSSDGVLRIAFVGRFVKSKGPDELLDAVREFLEEFETVSLQVDMIGNLVFSDPEVVEKVSAMKDSLNELYRDRVCISIHANASDVVKEQTLQDADLFVLPTYHEGFCVPIIEAISCGCKVVSYDNSNVGDVYFDLATLVEDGDITGLKRGIADFLSLIQHDSGRSTYEGYRVAASNYVERFHPSVVGQRFVSHIRNVLEERPLVVREG